VIGLNMSGELHARAEIGTKRRSVSFAWNYWFIFLSAAVSVALISASDKIGVRQDRRVKQRHISLTALAIIRHATIGRVQQRIGMSEAREQLPR
jgi:hypothetical protein